MAITEIDFEPGPFRCWIELGHIDFAVDSVSNQEFASDTVQKFYAGLDSTDNPVCAVPASEDIDVVHQANTPATSEQVT